MFSFVKYAAEIWAIGAEMDCPIDEAFDYFKNNVVHGKAVNEFKCCSHDWAKLHAEYTEPAHAITEWLDFADVKYTEMCALWVAKDKAGIAALIEGYKYIEDDCKAEA